MPWHDACYRSLVKDVSFLVGENAKDCGLLPLGASSHYQKQITACTKAAVASGRPFKAGYISFGDDSMFCDIIVRDGKGTYWSLFFDSDSTGQMGRGGDNSIISVGQCDGIDFKPGTIGHGSFFHAVNCKASPETVTEIISRRTK